MDDTGTCEAPSWYSSLWSSCSASTLRPVGIVAASTIGAMILSAILLLGVWRMLASSLGRWLGRYLRRKTNGQRLAVLEMMDGDQKYYEKLHRGEKATHQDDEWEHVGEDSLASAENGSVGPAEFDGVIGFFHPFCNAGGGGERVLWVAIRATQRRWPKAKCLVYTGDHEVNKEQMLFRVEKRFNIHLHAPTVNFVYLVKRHWVLASSWPHFTLAGQSIGSLVLAWDAFSILVPDIFVDTVGYAFASGFCKFLFPDVPTGAYVHYPTISTDMLDSLNPLSAVGQQGVNAGQGVGLRGWLKKLYWRVFAKMYSGVGSSIDVVMVNSSWTLGHIQTLWGAARQRNGKADISVVYPPVAVTELEQEVAVSEASERQREKTILYIAQFRPEKDHALILQSFADFIKTKTEASHGAKLVLVGSVRDASDSKRVYTLRLFVNELHLKDKVEFHLDAPWPQILEWLRRASVGVNGMWNEHFGIGVVEYQSAGLIAVVHDSGGPKLDIVTDFDGQPTGFHASTAAEFAEAFEKALSLANPLAWRLRARKSAKRFTEERFGKKWVAEMERLVQLAPKTID